MNINEHIKKGNELVSKENAIKRECFELLNDIIEDEITLSQKDSDEDECNWCYDNNGNKMQILKVRKTKTRPAGKSGIEILIYDKTETESWKNIECVECDILGLYLSVICDVQYQLSLLS